MSHNQYNNITQNVFYGNTQSINATVWSTFAPPKPLDWRKTPTGVNYGYGLREPAGLFDTFSTQQAIILSGTLSKLLAANQTFTTTTITGLTAASGKSIGYTTYQNTLCSLQNSQQNGPGELQITEETSHRCGFARRIMEFLKDLT